MKNMTAPTKLIRRRVLDDCHCDLWRDPRTERPVPHTHIILDRPQSELPWENR